MSTEGSSHLSSLICTQLRRTWHFLPSVSYEWSSAQHPGRGITWGEDNDIRGVLTGNMTTAGHWAELSTLVACRHCQTYCSLCLSVWKEHGDIFYS